MEVISIHDEKYSLSATEALVLKDIHKLNGLAALCVNAFNPDSNPGLILIWINVTRVSMCKRGFRE